MPDRAYPGQPPFASPDSFERPGDTSYEVYPDVPQSFISQGRDWEPFREEKQSSAGIESSPYAFSYRHSASGNSADACAAPGPQAPQPFAPAPEKAAVSETAQKPVQVPQRPQTPPAPDPSADRSAVRPEKETMPVSPARPAGNTRPAPERISPPAAAAPAPEIDPILAETRRQIAEQKARRASSFAPRIGDDDDYRYDDLSEAAPVVRTASRQGTREISNPVVKNLSDEDAAHALKATFAADIPQKSGAPRPASPGAPRRSGKKKKKNSRSNRILTALLVLFISVFVFSLVLLILNLYPRLRARSEYLDLKPENLARKGTVSMDVTAPEEETSDTPVLTREILDYYISVNDDFIGWIDVPGTNIHYPVVHGTDNDYYLRHTFKKEYSDYGAIFMDVENSADFSDDNSVLYGHNMRSGAMFHDVNTMHSNPDFAKEHMIFTITTRDGRILTYQVFSIYRVNVETDYRVANQGSGQARIDYFNRLKGYSAIDFGPVTFTESSSIVTFSTCPPDSADDWRVALHAVLIDTSQL
ncbi:MAG: class B sortase [Clostridia bacterium]|nr:class B sortase [Clostridia bacterium]